MLGSKRRIYLDHASATPVSQEAQRAMREAEDISGNPGGIHAEGVAALQSLTQSRESIAAELGCKPRELIFTSGLTEANNVAILGFAQALDRADGPPAGGLSTTHWIVSSIEHLSVLECFAEIERLGGKVTHVDPMSSGLIDPGHIARAIRKETVMVSIGWANSEIGVVQPISDIARAIRAQEKGHATTILLHSDAGQAPLYRAPKVATLGADLLSLGSGKLYGPRGIGCLFVGRRASLSALMSGGSQERGLRPGTEPVALAAGFAEALRCAGKDRAAEGKRLQTLRNDFARQLVAHIPGVVQNGDIKHALPHVLNVSIPDIDSEYLVLALDRAGIALSTKAACSEGHRGESHVVAALGGDAWRSHNTLRFSFGKATGSRDVRRAVKIVLSVLEGLPERK